MKVTLDRLATFFDTKNVAIAGVSRNKKKFGNQIYAALKNRGFNVIPINPNADKIDDIPCLKGVEDLNSNTDRLIIVTPKSETDAILKAALEKGIKHIWIQQHSETDKSLSLAEEYKQEIITKRCVFMFAEPVNGIHKFHRFILKTFNKYPG